MIERPPRPVKVDKSADAEAEEGSKAPNALLSGISGHNPNLEKKQDKQIKVMRHS
jgi:hypothetical protein